ASAALAWSRSSAVSSRQPSPPPDTAHANRPTQDCVLGWIRRREWSARSTHHLHVAAGWSAAFSAPHAAHGPASARAAMVPLSLPPGAPPRAFPETSALTHRSRSRLALGQ